MNEYEKMMEDRGIRVTAVRLLVFKAMLESPQAFSLTGLEEKLDTVDKSTLSRIIRLFHNKLLIHSIDDGSGSMKYSVCNSDCMCTLKELHAHFFCNRCKKTYCLENVHIPGIQLPAGYLPQSINFVVKGICGNCSSSAT